MLHRIMTAGFEDVVEADEVRFDIGVRVGDGVAHARLRCEVDHDLRLVLLEDFVNEHLVCKVSFDKSVILKLLEHRKASFLDANIIIIVHVVQTNNLNSIRLSGQNTFSKIGTDEAG